MAITASIQPGTVVGDRYRVIAELGGGAMGRVFRAEHVHMANELAIKVLSPEMLSIPTLRERFEREARSVARLDHPNIVRVTDFGYLGTSGPFMVMELVQGVPLSRYVDKKPLGIASAIQLQDQLLQALEHAHAAGVVHRDLKPDNIMVIERDDYLMIKVLDFGLAKLTHDLEGTITEEGQIFGTPRYMSPEQAQGEAVDERSDLYAAAVIFYELLTQRPLFQSSSVLEVIDKQIHEKPGPLHLPPGAGYDADAFEKVLETALAKKPPQRYASATRFRQALRSATTLLPSELSSMPPRAFSGSGTLEITGSSVEDIVASDETKRRRKRIALGAGIVSALLLAGVLAAKVLLPEPPRERAETLLRAGNLSGARIAAEQAAREDPDDPRTLALLGHLAHLGQDAERTSTHYTRALALDGRLGDDPVLKNDTRELLRAGLGESMVKAIAEHGTESAAPFLTELAIDAAPEIRRIAYEGLERLKLTERVEPRGYLLEGLRLNRGSKCSVRRWYAERLLALPGPEAAVMIQAELEKNGQLSAFVASRCMAPELEPLVAAHQPKIAP